jgi:MFS family permease
MYVSTCIALLGGVIMIMSYTTSMVVISLLITGVGLAAAFPVILGIVGDRFTKYSGTAFGIVLTIALIGNMIANFLIGIMTNIYGTEILPQIFIAMGICTTVLLFYSLKTID